MLINNKLNLKYFKGSTDPLICNIPLDCTNASGKVEMKKGISSYTYPSPDNMTESLTFSRGSGQWVRDYEGQYRWVADNCAGIEGSRIVTNLCLNSQNFSSSWSLTGSLSLIGTVTDSKNTQTASRFNCTASNDRIQCGGYSIVIGTVYRLTVDLRSSATQNISIILYDGKTLLGTNFPISQTWKRYSVLVTATNTTTNGIIQPFRLNSNESCWVEVGFVQLEVVNGQSNTAPSEYIPTTSAPITQCFNYKNPNTVDGNGVVIDSGIRTPIESELIQNGANGWTYTNDNPDWWSLEGSETATEYVTQTVDGLKIKSTNGSYFGISKILPTCVGVTYEVTLDVIVNAGYCNISLNSYQNLLIPNTTGVYKATFTSSVKNDAIFIKRGTSGVNNDFIIKSISVKPVITGLLCEPLSTNKVTCYNTLQESLSSEMITAQADREFSSDTGWWTKLGSLCSIADGVMKIRGVLGVDGYYKSILSLGRIYQITFTVSRVGAGSCGLQVQAGSSFDIVYTTGTYTRTLFCGGTASNVRFYPSSTTTACDIDIDNISVKEVVNAVGTKATALSPNAIQGTIFSGYTVTAGKTTTIGAQYKITARDATSPLDWSTVGTLQSGTANTIGAIYLCTSVGTLVGNDTADNLSVYAEIVDDAVNLANAGLSGIVPSNRVVKMDNTLNSRDIYLICSGGTGNTTSNGWSMQIVGKQVNGVSGNLIGWDDLSSVSSTLTTAYSQIKMEGKTPPTSASRVTVKCVIGSILNFILPQLEEQPYVTSPIPTFGTTGQRNATVFSFPTGVDIKTNKCTNYNVIPSDTLGSELITAQADREFTSDTGWWSKDTGCSINTTTGEGVINTSTVGYGIYRASGNNIVTAGKMYLVKYTIKSIASGSVQIKMGELSLGAYRTTTGTYYEYLIAKGSPFFQIGAGTANTNATVDDISLKEITPSLGSDVLSGNNFTGWTTQGTGVSINSGNIVLETPSSTTPAYKIAVSLGKFYQITYTLSITSGSVYFRAGVSGANGIGRTTSNTYTEILPISDGNTCIELHAANTTNATISNITVKECQYMVGTKSYYYNSTWYQNHTNMTLSGDPAATLTTVDDTQALTDAGLIGITGSKVYEFSNTGTTDALCVISGQCGNANNHIGWGYIRKIFGSTAILYLGNSSNNTPIVSTSYNKLNCPATNNVSVNALAFKLPPNNSIRFILNQLEESTTCNPDPIISYGAAGKRSYGGKNIKNNDFSLYLEWKYSGSLPASNNRDRILQSTIDNYKYWFLNKMTSNISCYSGNNNIYKSAYISDTTNTRSKIMAVHSSSNFAKAFCNGNIGNVPSTNTTSLSNSSKIAWRDAIGTLRNIRIYKKPLSDSQCVNLTK
jgi:hypothetical protein